MFKLTKQEQTVLAVAIFLLLTGLAVKTYRTAHPPESPDVGAEKENHAGN